MRGSLRQLKPIVAGSGGGRRSEGDIVCVPTLQVGSIVSAGLVLLNVQVNMPTESNAQD